MAKKAVNSLSKVCVYKSALKGGCLSSVVRLGQRVSALFHPLAKGFQRFMCGARNFGLDLKITLDFLPHVTMSGRHLTYQ